jgi:hypothetical protein
MVAAISFRHFVIGGALLLGVMSSSVVGHAQLPPPPPTPCSSGGECNGGGGGSSSGGNYGGAIGEIVGLPGDLIRAHNKAKLKKATAVNEQGLAAYSSGDWAAAAAHFKKALQLNPKDGVIRANLAAAQTQLGYAEARRMAERQSAAENLARAHRAQQQQQADRQKAAEAAAQAQREQAQRQQDKIAADNIQRHTETFAHSLSAAPSPDGLDFNAGTDTNAQHQEKAAASTSIKGANATSDEDAAKWAGKIFDRGGGDRADEDDAPKISLSSPTAASDLSSRVDKVLASDKDYQALVAHRAQAVQDASNAQRQLEALKAKQQSETDPTKRQQNQIQISNVTTQLGAAKTSVATDEIKQDDITRRVIYTVTVIPAAGSGENLQTQAKKGAESGPAANAK